ncbi:MULTISPECIES: 2-amino-4-hydroxy-6-hydroxymethyldihydropteridine diphosphokinase [unclassified Candidatus Frackibacter]|uniref:2-amino-4-hydroxy-6- hydroxymethyldihydropteridine diphosphokinase n=1 Tax=unclassified Candidatus Frackibacter TaxID=2648818 RepID=UPI00079BBB10|nr:MULTISPECIES: 2-amino-4-hydroxy-6-hydroxymethyldihydropteridine diphosphokinase [unclassified Candidatus Frackibacter]KXS45983.1 MAG: 2-amino-4-hydroxy-6-hydroxymethyldihydropteridine diphosphokinase [Candidatus Frackibacter sp. T328-2]SDC03919.1 2-amino-4-hydroxy-6-hydroxymethyldihydropteridinediphosphokinase [Candidatus Frackibacter sp. WG11]SEM68527.1 2-amino-4-hydroxy-6-hydroxymethyldihydropteridinediphosphokinase [Candidatus Frackibacter sp. WG12]SFL79812.1 2-amino-4-hydroxy-6-hydroxyme
MEVVYLSLGSNLGDREEYLRDAIIKLKDNKAIELKKVSSIYQTDPVGYTEQPDFLNLVVKVETFLNPIELLDYIQKVELDLERVRDIRWGPRTIDIDIILFGERKVNTERLTIPHMRFHERAFVLAPLAELTTEVVYDGKTATELLDHLSTELEIEEYAAKL